MATGSHPVFSVPITLRHGPVCLIIFCITDILRKFSRSFTSVRISVGWEWSVDGINWTADNLTSRTTFNVYIYDCKNVFLIKIRKWKASWEQSLPTGFLWKLTRSNEVWNWPTFKKPPKLQKRKRNSEIWSECKLRRVLVILEFVLDVWLFGGVQGKHCFDLLLTFYTGLARRPATQKTLGVFVDYTLLVTVT